MDKDTYKKYLRENVIKTYKKSNRKKLNKINIEAKKIATKLKIDNRVQQFHETEAFITVKDHMDTFSNFPTFRTFLLTLLNQRLVKLVNRFLTRSVMR